MQAQKKMAEKVKAEGEPEPEPGPDDEVGRWQGRVRCYFPGSRKLVEEAHLELAKGGALQLSPVSALRGHDSTAVTNPVDGEDSGEEVAVVHSGEAKDCEVDLPKALTLQPRPLPWKITSYTIEPMLWMTTPAIRLITGSHSSIFLCLPACVRVCVCLSLSCLFACSFA